MARVRSPNRDKAFEIYKLNNGEILLKDIAAQLNVSESTVRSWKTKDNWEGKINGALQINKRSAPNKKVTKKKVTKQAINDEVESVLENTELTEKQRLFCIYYIEDFNATKAYQKAYKCDYQTAHKNGWRLKANEGIKLEIDRLTEECLQEQEINSKLLNKRVFQKYMNIAFSDITDFLEFNSEKVEGEFGPYLKNSVVLKDSTQLDGTLISEISEGKDGVKVKLLDKMKALQWLSDRTDLLPTHTQAKLDLEILKLEVEMNKLDNTEEEVEEDGFIEALDDTAKEVWDDEED
nr:MAG TPA: Terminase small subunit [Caudoviricetes sp.]